MDNNFDFIKNGMNLAVPDEKKV